MDFGDDGVDALWIVALLSDWPRRERLAGRNGVVVTCEARNGD
jgi:hypothetical protein